MSEAIISIENLGKRYRIDHLNNGHRATTFRETITQNTAALWGRILRRSQSCGSVDRDTRRKREDFWALRNVSFEVKEGEVLGIIGRNGAGKSTLLKVLSRITEPTEGRVAIHGRVASLLEVGTGFHPELTGRENIYLNGAILGMKRAEIKRKFDEIVAFAEVEKFLDTPVKRYSSGMYVRLAFAVAAHLEPELLIVDEVLAVGDVTFQKKCLGKLKSVANEGRTILFVSHNIGAINTLCTSAIWLDKGLLRSSGSTLDITKEYLGSTPSKSRIDFLLSTTGKGQILAAELRAADGTPSISFACGDEVAVLVRFILHQRVRDCHVGCVVTTSDGFHLFSSADNDANPEMLDTREPGEYVAKVGLPTSFLNEGMYHIAVSLGIPGGEGFDRRDAFSFSLYDGADRRTGKEGSRRAGALVLQIPWKYLPPDSMK